MVYGQNSFFPRELLTPTTLDDWTREANFQRAHLIPDDEALDWAMKNCEDHALPDINVEPAQGKFMSLLCQVVGVKRIVEVGTLGGYSTIWFARGVPDDGEVITMEISPKYADVARENIEHAGLSHKVKVITGAGADVLPTLGPDHSFDLIFVDADKKSNPIYYAEAKRLVKKGGIIIVDNVVRNARPSNPSVQGAPDIDGVRALLKIVKEDKEVSATTLGTVGEKGYDGFMFCRVLP
ncbi:S-adenosyl-L-methionine-dependent methyltransferase [Heliocybe sulcata]|uniref:S-adenosyl-L-methionine-dependent methyltransferase n=1 Tax=Heliocybe sulcata TaxID=5364 RepID=A0A5C3NDI9_9AGAM|nr:S-adenosyl-L-methionine-dependent methyltransferase [Heliocybe sulcata]